MKLILMLLPWVMAKLDQIIEHLLRRNREDMCKTMNNEAKGKRDGDA